MNRYKPTLSEFIRYWEPSSDDSLTLVLFGAYVATLTIASII